MTSFSESDGQVNIICHRWELGWQVCVCVCGGGGNV